MYIIKKILLIVSLSILLIYVTNITGIPDNIVLFEGEDYSLGTIYGIFQTRERIVATSLDSKDNNIVKEETVHLNFLNIFNLKNVKVTVIEHKKVIPLRKYCRIKIVFKRSIDYRYDRNRRQKTL